MNKVVAGMWFTLFTVFYYFGFISFCSQAEQVFPIRTYGPLPVCLIFLWLFLPVPVWFYMVPLFKD